MLPTRTYFKFKDMHKVKDEKRYSLQEETKK